ncbi:hypothetical protein CCR75_002423 [Bremia lactucae]|uniref:Uncharacterized protein n=1 Tax=Bremia lactucae TaxID=4779 RepID=A0A976FI48_BRELC|nr:hypothetical protein CCR75_002423 [Bremia lactucae]
MESDNADLTLYLRATTKICYENNNAAFADVREDNLIGIYTIPEGTARRKSSIMKALLCFLSRLVDY